MPLAVKLLLGSEIRRVGLDPTGTLTEFLARMTRLSGLTFPAFLYYDDFGHWVTCGSELEFREAMRIATGLPGGVLRVKPIHPTKATPKGNGPAMPQPGAPCYLAMKKADKALSAWSIAPLTSFPDAEPAPTPTAATPAPGPGTPRSVTSLAHTESSDDHWEVVVDRTANQNFGAQSSSSQPAVAEEGSTEPATAFELPRWAAEVRRLAALGLEDAPVATALLDAYGGDLVRVVEAALRNPTAVLRCPVP